MTRETHLPPSWIKGGSQWLIVGLFFGTSLLSCARPGWIPWLRVLLGVVGFLLAGVALDPAVPFQNWVLCAALSGGAGFIKGYLFDAPSGLASTTLAWATVIPTAILAALACTPVARRFTTVPLLPVFSITLAWLLLPWSLPTAMVAALASMLCLPLVLKQRPTSDGGLLRSLIVWEFLALHRLQTTFSIENPSASIPLGLAICMVLAARFLNRTRQAAT